MPRFFEIPTNYPYEKPLSGHPQSSTDANNITVSYFYDANNTLTALIDGNGNQRTRTYDARNLKIQKTNPGAGDVRTYTYDALRRLDNKTDQLSDTCQTIYDLAGRMTSKEYKTGGTTLESTDTFVYDAASRLISSTKGRYNVTVTHSYTLDGMPTREGFTIDGRNYTISRAYDAGNRPISHTFADGKSQLWSYDARNLVTNLSYDGQNVLTQTYDPGYRLTNQTLGNGLTRTLSYSRQDNFRTSDVTFDGITAIDSLNWSYTYNEDKQVTSENTAASFLDDTSFTATYDPGNRLISWNRTGLVTVGARETESWAYDNAGNHNSVTRDGTNTNRTHNTDNELTALGGTATTFDAKGNMTEDAEGNEYFYDLDNRINRIEMNGGATIELAYDALGRRVFRKNGSDEKAYLWWGDQETSEHESSAGQPVIQNDLWAHPAVLNQVCARAVDGSKFDMEYYHKNYLDHVYAVSDDTGNIQEHYRYSAFGEVEIYSPTGAKLASTAIDNEVLWNSRRFDFDTNLYYYKYRHYKADYGRWLGRDPIGLLGGFNSYEAMRNNPIDYIDVKGLWVNYAVGILSSLTASALENLFDDFAESGDAYGKDLFEEQDVAGESDDTLNPTGTPSCPRGSGWITWQTKTLGSNFWGKLQVKGKITWEYRNNSIYDLKAFDNGSTSTMQSAQGFGDDSGIIIVAKVSTTREYDPCGLCSKNKAVAKLTFGGIQFEDGGTGNTARVCHGEYKITGQGEITEVKDITCTNFSL